MSQEGPQQGDPLGPLLFCNTIHPLLTSLGSVLLGYMDDVWMLRLVVLKTQLPETCRL